MDKNLPVKIFQQWDSETNEGHRMCASSVMSMAIHYLSPGLISQKQINDAGYSQLDDYYLKELIEKQGGNTNDPEFDVKVLRQLGFNDSLMKDGSWQVVDRQLQEGIPVPLVIAHHGPSSSPDVSRWHWILCRGAVSASKSHVFNDPAGELDVRNGGYHTSDNGNAMQYSDQNLTPRWQTDGPNRGWYIKLLAPFPKAKAAAPVAVKKEAPAPKLKK